MLIDGYEIGETGILTPRRPEVDSILKKKDIPKAKLTEAIEG